MRICGEKLTAAVKRLCYRMMVSGGLYGIMALGVGSYRHLHHPHGAALYVEAVLMMLPFLGIIASFGLYLYEEHDEFMYTLSVQSSLWATGITVVLANLFIQLHHFASVPVLTFRTLVVIWGLVFAITMPFVSRRYK